MADAKFFSKGKASEIEEELKALDKAGKSYKKKDVLKRIVANMTMGNDMSSLFNYVIQCAAIQDPEVKKLIYLYLINYAKSLPDLATLAVNLLVKDSADPNPLVRAQAIRTMGYLPSSDVTQCLCEVLRRGIKDHDPFVRKTSVIGVSKLFFHNSTLCMDEGFISSLQEILFTEQNGLVVACILATLKEISDYYQELKLVITSEQAEKLATMLEKCSEWYQFYILEVLMYYTPAHSEEAEAIAGKLILRLQHTNATVCMSCIKVLLYLLRFSSKMEFHQLIQQKISTSLVTLMRKGPEIQYMTLRNIIIIIAMYPAILANDVSVFFCMYNDPIYIKMAKLEVMSALANEKNAAQILSELKEYATEIDVEFVKKSIKYIGQCAIQMETMADACMQVLKELIDTRVTYVLEEVIVVLRDIFRKYPNKYEYLIVEISEYLDDLQDSESKAAFIWILGNYCDRIQQAGEILLGFASDLASEPHPVQQAMLTAAVRLYLKNVPGSGELYEKVMETCLQLIEHPDVRDRAFIYSRLIQQNIELARQLSLQPLPAITFETKQSVSAPLLKELSTSIGSLASVMHKPPETFLLKDVQPSDPMFQSTEVLHLRSSPTSAAYPSPNTAPTQEGVQAPNMLIDFNLSTASTGVPGSHNVSLPSGATSNQNQAQTPQSKSSDPPSSVFYDLATIESASSTTDPFRSNDASPSKSFLSAMASSITSSPSSNPPYSNPTLAPSTSLQNPTTPPLREFVPPTQASTQVQTAPSGSPPSGPFGASLLPSTSGASPFLMPSSSTGSGVSTSVSTERTSNTLIGLTDLFQPVTPPTSNRLSSGTSTNPFSQLMTPPTQPSLASGFPMLTSYPISTSFAATSTPATAAPTTISLPTMPAAVNTMSGGMAMLGAKVGAAREAPPIVLKRQDGGGLEIHGRLQRTGQTLSIEFTMNNTTMAALTHFAFKLKDNHLGLQAPTLFPIATLAPNMSAQVILPLTSGVRIVDKAAADLEAAIRTSQGVYFFRLLLPLPLHFCEHSVFAGLEEYYAHLQSKASYEKSVSLLNTFDAVKRKLELCCFQSVASNQERGEPPVLHSYFGAKLITHVPVCIHIKSNANFVSNLSTFDTLTIRIVSPAKFMLEDLLKFLEGP